MTVSEYNITLKKYKDIIQKSRFSDLLGLSPELLDNLADYCVLGKVHKVNYNHSSLFYIINSILAVFCNSFCNLFFKRFSKVKGPYRYYFIKSPSTFNRFGKLSFAIGNSTVCTIPTFDLKGILKRFSKEAKETSNPVILLLSIKDVIMYLIFIFRNIMILRHIGNKREYLEVDYNPNKFLLVFILKYLVCIKSILHLKQSIIDAKYPAIITDHDKTPIVFALKHIRDIYQLNYKIITINHGAFCGFNLYYTKPYSDLIMCTCQREVELTKKYSNNCNVHFYGIQLSTFIEDINNKSTIDPQYDVLVLGTNTRDSLGDSFGKLQLELIKYLKNNKINFKYRLRPDSATEDKKYFKNALSDEDYTKGTTLYEDCASSKKIISFSLDALGRAVILKRKVAIYIDEQTYSDFSAIGMPSTEVFVTKDFDKVIDFINLRDQSDTNYQVNTYNWIYNNIGELKFDKIVKNIKGHI